MFQKDNLQNRLQQNELKMRELTINLERLDLEYQQLFQEVGLTLAQIQTYISNEANFSQSIWEKFQKQKKELDEKLKLTLDNVTDPAHLKKKFSERGSIQNHWIFVR